MTRLRSLGKILGYYVKYSPLYLCLFYLEVIIGAWLSVFKSIYLIRYIFNAFDNQISLRDAIIYLFCALITNTLFFLFSNWMKNCYSPASELRVRKIIQTKLFEKAANVRLKYFENTDFYDGYMLALQHSKDIGSLTLQSTGALLSNLISIVLIVTMLFTVDFFIVVLILFSVLIGFWVDISLAKNHEKKDVDTIKLNRKIDYYKRVFYITDIIEELKLLQRNEFIFEEQNEAYKNMHIENKKYGKKLVKLYAIKGLCESLLTSFAVYFLLIYKLMISKSIRVGDFSATVNSVWGLSNQLTQLVNNITNVYKHSIYCDKIFKFQDMDIEYSDDLNKAMCPKTAKKIEIKNVYFSYNGKDNILNDINLTIKEGQKIAIVGENGSGKTTLVNLLLSLYQDYQGSILLDRKSISEYDRKELYKYMSCLFQDFNIYALSVSENVAMDIVDRKKEQDIYIALDKVGLIKKINTLQDGLNTIMTKEYADSSVEFSKGDNQKIALARILVSKSCVVILDEPSSAMDPVSENSFNNMLMSAFDDRTVIFITHRFFSTRQADTIVLIDKGHIKEIGTHQELMDLNGKYSKMYNLQKAKYNL